MLCMEPHFVCSLYAGVLFFVGGGYFFNPQAPTPIPHYVIKTNKDSPNHVAFGRDILFKFPYTQTWGKNIKVKKHGLSMS